MMKRIMTGLVAISAAFVLNACGATCEDACANQVEVCAAELGDQKDAETEGSHVVARGSNRRA